MSTNINSTEQIVEINAGDQITNVNIVSQSTTQVISGEQVVTIDTNAGTIPAAWGSITGTLSNQTDLQNALNLKQNNITLTTTGTTGVASLVGSTLNIPNYVSSTKQSQWDSAYNDKINSAEVSGTTTKTLTLTQQDGGIIQASWSDFDTAPVTSVFGRTGDVVSAEGDYNINQLGDVTITSATNGQVLKYNGTAWVNAADASGLTSVGLAMPSAFTVSGSPLTSNGTITVTGAGTTSQYVRGDGSLATFPTTSNEAKTLIREVYNSTGATLTKGTVVYINGGQGNLPTITKAIASGDPTSAQTFGIVQSDITNMNNGFVVVAGGIDNLDTQAYTVGTALYLSPTTAGAWTSTKPYAPNHLVYLGVVVRSHPTQGVIEVKIQNGYELDELHNVSARFPTNKDGLFYNSTSNVWENKSIAGVLGYTPVPQSRIITINGTAQDLSADRTYNVGTVTSIAASGGTGISISGSPVTGSGTISIVNTAPDQTVTITPSGLATVSGIYPNFTVGVSDAYAGSVTSVNASVPTGFEVSGVPITTAGTIDIKFASGYSLPTTAKQTQWDDAYTKRINSLTVTGNSGSSTLISNVLNVPTYTLSGLGGEPAITAGTSLQYWRGDKTFQTLNTGVVPESGNVYFTEPRVRATVLSGLNITGGSISASDSVLDAFGKVQNQINGLMGGSIFQSTWNASTNTPTLTSSVGTKGYYYIVSVAGTTNLNGITDWQIGDWAIFDGTVWRKVDNTDAVVSVNGFTGTVSLGISNLADVSASTPTDTQLLRFNGTTSKWYNWTPTFEPALTKGNLTEATSSVLTITGGSNAVIGSGTSIQVKQASSTGSGYLSSTDWNTFNNKQATISLTTTGSSGASTFVSNVLNVPNYTLSGLGGVPTSRTLTINGTGYDLSADRTWSVGTVTSIALATGTSGTDVNVSGSPVTGSGTITLNIPDASATARGLITTGTQTIAGAKTLTNALSGTSATFSSTLTATGGVYVGNGTAGRNAFSQSDFRIAAPNDTNILNGIAANTSMTIKSDYYGGGSATPLILQSGANNNQLYLTTSGNVSIGNTNNTYKLDVSGTGNFTGALTGTSATFSGTTTVYDADLYVTNVTGSGGAKGNVIISSDRSIWWGSYGSNVWIGGNSSSNTMVFYNTTAQNIGSLTVGSSDVAAYTLDVRGTGRFTGALSGTSATFSSSVTASYFTSDGSSLYSYYIRGRSSDNYGVIGFYSNNGSTRYGYIQSHSTNGGQLTIAGDGGTYLRLDNTVYISGAATFSSSVTANATSTFSNASGLSAIFSNGGAGGNYNSIELRGGTVGSAVNWQISKDNSTANAFELAPSTAAGGTTYGSPVFKILNTGAATFSSTVTTAGDVLIQNANPILNLQRSNNASSPAARINFLTSDNTVRWQIATNQAVGTGFEINQGDGATNRLYINTSGNVGIGTTSPATDFQVVRSGSVTGRFTNTATSVNTEIGVTGGLGYVGTQSANAFGIFTSDTERMRITSGGRLLVGETSDVYVSKFALSYDPTSTNGPIFLDNRTYGIDKGGAMWLGGKYNTAGNYRPFGGFVAAKENATDGNSAGYLSFFTNSNAADAAERMRITSGGNVLIGTTTDSGQKLQINGNTYTNGSIKTSNPNGGTATPWKLGSRIVGTCSASTSAYLEVDINGTLYYLAFAVPL